MKGLIAWRGFRIQPYNIPLSKPGAYRFTNLENGKVYIGISSNVAHRCQNHGSSSPPKFRAALKRYGKPSFICEPVLYWSEGAVLDRFWLAMVEAELIELHNSVRNGYNVKAAEGSVGPYGEEWLAALKAGQDSNWRIRQRAAILEKRQDPVWQANHAAAMEKMHASEEWLAAIREGARKRKEKAVPLTPEQLERVRTAARNRVYSPEALERLRESGRKHGAAGGYARAANLAPEELAEIGRRGGLIGGHKGGLAAQAKLTPEERVVNASRAGRAAHAEKDPVDGKSVLAKRLGQASKEKTDPEARRAGGRKGGAWRPEPGSETIDRMQVAARQREAARKSRHPGLYGMKEASKKTGRSKPTIILAIKNGILSAIQEQDGMYFVDPVELHKAFPALTQVS